LNISASGNAQLSLSAGAGFAQWAFRNAGGNFYLATTTTDGTATSSLSALSILGASGNVGIGTDNPSTLFNIVSQQTATTTARVANYSANNAGNMLQFFKARGTLSAPAQTCGGDCGAGDNLGQINFTGYGTSAEYTPAYLKVIAGGSSGNGSLSNTVGSSQWEFYNAKTNAGPTQWLRVTPDGVARFFNNAFTIADTGALGLTAGLTVPSGSGYGYTPSNIYIPQDGSVTGSRMMSQNAVAIIIDSDANANTDAFTVRKDSTTIAASNELFRIQDNGNVGIGSSSPQSPLSVMASSSSFVGSILNVSSSTNASLFNVQHNGNLGIGTSTPYSLLSIQGSSALTNPLFAVATTTSVAPAFQIDQNGLLTMNTPGATSTITGNLYVNGTLRATNSYAGDLIFANNFRFTEAPLNGTPQGLYLKNQHMNDLLSIDEQGNMTVTGDICANGSQCFGKSLDSLTSTVATASSTVNTILAAQSSASQSLSQISVSLQNAQSSITDLADKVSAFAASTEASSSDQISMLVTQASSTVETIGTLSSEMVSLTNRVEGIASTTAELASSTSFISAIASSVSSALASSTSFVQSVASDVASAIASSTSMVETLAAAVKGSLQASTDWIFAKLTAHIAYVDELHAGALAVGTSEKPSGITLYDQNTGNPYCFKIMNGMVNTIVGECSAASPAPAPTFAEASSSDVVTATTASPSASTIAAISAVGTTTVTTTVDGTQITQSSAAGTPVAVSTTTSAEISPTTSGTDASSASDPTTSAADTTTVTAVGTSDAPTSSAAASAE
jgi:hypothetical protein